jgi:hypothetical protein
VKVAALVAGATALANKVRREAPKKVQQLQEKRAAGRHVIISEIAGRTVAIGPYPTGQAAREDRAKVAGATQLVELLSPTAYSASQDLTSSDAR